jgi:hypothetical protein
MDSVAEATQPDDTPAKEKKPKKRTLNPMDMESKGLGPFKTHKSCMGDMARERAKIMQPETTNESLTSSALTSGKNSTIVNYYGPAEQVNEEIEDEICYDETQQS